MSVRSEWIGMIVENVSRWRLSQENSTVPQLCHLYSTLQGPTVLLALVLKFLFFYLDF